MVENILEQQPFSDVDYILSNRQNFSDIKYIISQSILDFFYIISRVIAKNETNQEYSIIINDKVNCELLSGLLFRLARKFRKI